MEFRRLILDQTTELVGSPRSIFNKELFHVKTTEIIVIQKELEAQGALGALETLGTLRTLGTLEPWVPWGPNLRPR